MAPQYAPYGIDLGQIFMAAQQAKAQQFQIEQARQQAAMQRQAQQDAHDRQIALESARQDYQTAPRVDAGQRGLLRALAPQEAQAIDAEQLKQQQFAFEQAKELDAQGQMRARMAAEAQAASNDPAARAVLNQFPQLRRGTPEWAQAYEGMRRQMVAEDLAQRKAGATSISVSTGENGGQSMPLTSSNVGQAQDEFQAQKQVLSDIANLRGLYAQAGGIEKTQTAWHQANEAGGRIVNKIVPSWTSDETKHELELGAQKDAALGRLRVSFIVQANKRGMTSEAAQEMFDTYVPKEGDAPVTIKAKLTAIEQLAKGRMAAAQEALTKGLQFEQSTPRGEAALAAVEAGPGDLRASTEGQQAVPPADAVPRSHAPAAAPAPTTVPAKDRAMIIEAFARRFGGRKPSEADVLRFYQAKHPEAH